MPRSAGLQGNLELFACVRSCEVPVGYILSQRLISQLLSWFYKGYNIGVLFCKGYNIGVNR
jgi:hypothetical protein